MTAIPYRALLDSLCVHTGAYFGLALIDRLLRDDAAAAREVIARKDPEFPSKEAFLRFLDTISVTHTPIRRSAEDALEINWG